MSARVSKALVLIGHSLALLGEEIGNPALVAEVKPQKTEPQKTEPQKTEPQKTEPQKTEPQKTEPAKAEPPKAEPAKAEDLRAKVRALIQAKATGHKEQVVAVLAAYGATKQSEIPEGKLLEVIAQLEMIEA